MPKQSQEEGGRVMFASSFTHTISLVVGSGFSRPEKGTSSGRDASRHAVAKASGMNASPTKSRIVRLPWNSEHSQAVVGSGFSRPEKGTSSGRDASRHAVAKASGMNASPTKIRSDRLPWNSEHSQAVVGSGFSRPEKGTSSGRDALRHAVAKASGMNASPTKSRYVGERVAA